MIKRWMTENGKCFGNHLLSHLLSILTEKRDDILPKKVFSIYFSKLVIEQTYFILDVVAIFVAQGVPTIRGSFPPGIWYSAPSLFLEKTKFMLLMLDKVNFAFHASIRIFIRNPIAINLINLMPTCRNEFLRKSRSSRGNISLLSCSPLQLEVVLMERINIGPIFCRFKRDMISNYA